MKKFCMLKDPKLSLNIHCTTRQKSELKKYKCECGIQGCILLTYLSVISSKFIQKFAQKCQYFTLIDQSVPLDNFYITFYLRTNQRRMQIPKINKPSFKMLPAQDCCSFSLFSLIVA